MSNGDDAMTSAEFAKLMGAYPEPAGNPLPTYGGYMDNSAANFSWVQNNEYFGAEESWGFVVIDGDGVRTDAFRTKRQAQFYAQKSREEAGKKGLRVVKAKESDDRMNKAQMDIIFGKDKYGDDLYRKPMECEECGAFEGGNIDGCDDCDITYWFNGKVYHPDSMIHIGAETDLTFPCSYCGENEAEVNVQDLLYEWEIVGDKEGARKFSGAGDSLLHIGDVNKLVCDTCYSDARDDGFYAETDLTPTNHMNNSIGQVVPITNPMELPTNLIETEAGGGPEGQITPDVFSADARELYRTDPDVLLELARREGLECMYCEGSSFHNPVATSYSKATGGATIYYPCDCGETQVVITDKTWGAENFNAEKKNCGCGKDPCITYGVEMKKGWSCKYCGHDLKGCMSHPLPEPLTLADEVCVKCGIQADYDGELGEHYGAETFEAPTYISKKMREKHFGPRISLEAAKREKMRELRTAFENPNAFFGHSMEMAYYEYVEPTYGLSGTDDLPWDDFEKFVDMFSQAPYFASLREKKTVPLPKSAETFEAPYGGTGAIMDIGKETPLADFTDEELTTSSAIHGDFDQASLNYSGHQNIEVKAETEEDLLRRNEAWWLKDYNEYMEDPQPEGEDPNSLWTPTLEEFKKERSIQTHGRKYYEIIQKFEQDLKDRRDGDLYDENTVNKDHMLREINNGIHLLKSQLPYLNGKSLLKIDIGIEKLNQMFSDADVYGAETFEAFQNNPEFKEQNHYADEEEFYEMVAEMDMVSDGMAVVSNIHNETVGAVEVIDDKDDDEMVEISIQDENLDEIGSFTLDDGMILDDEDNYLAENKVSPMALLTGVVIGGLAWMNRDKLSASAKSMFSADTQEVLENAPELVENPDTGDLDPAQYEELVVESTGYALDIIPMGLDGSFMGSRFAALPTERYVEYNDPGIGAHTDIAMNRDEVYLEPEMAMVQAAEGEPVVKEAQAPGQSPYLSVDGQEPKDFSYRVIKETHPVSLDPAVVPFIPQSMAGYTGNANRPPSVYEKMFNIGVLGQTPLFTPQDEGDIGASHAGSRRATPNTLGLNGSVGGPLSDKVNANYTDGTTSMSLAQWAIENTVSQSSDTEAVVIDRSSGAMKRVRRV